MFQAQPPPSQSHNDPVVPGMEVDTMPRFLQEVLRKNPLAALTKLRISVTPALALTAKVAFEGDTDGWHYDPNDGVVTLLLQAPDQGGGFEYAPNIRSDGDENYAGLKDLFEDPDQHGKRVEQRPGTLVFFNGRNSMHRVRPVGPTKAPRIVTIFSYDLRPTQVFGHSYVSMIHTLAQGAP